MSVVLGIITSYLRYVYLLQIQVLYTADEDAEICHTLQWNSTATLEKSLIIS